MESIHVGARITWGRAIALLAVIAIAVVAFASPRGAEAGSCHSLAQNITKLKHVSCKSARRLVNSAYRAGVEIPECKGRDANAHWKGWKFKAIDNRGIIVRVTKGNKRFILSGGGAC